MPKKRGPNSASGSLQPRKRSKQVAKRKNRQRKLEFDDVVLSFQGIELAWDSRCETSATESRLLDDVASSLYRGFHIDKSYVEFDGNVHSDAYIDLPDWQWICAAAQLPRDSRTSFQQVMLEQAYEMLVLGYAYRMLEGLGIDISEVDLSVGSSPFVVEMRYDVSHEWHCYAKSVSKISANSRNRKNLDE